MRVLRVEHMSVLRNGRPAGPYSDISMREAEHYDETTDYWSSCPEERDCFHYVIDRWCDENSDNTPTPCRDGLGYPGMNFLYCFIREEQIDSWFGNRIEDLEKMGFVLAVYEVPGRFGIVHHGGRQSVFRYSESVRIGDTSLVSRKNLRQLIKG